MDVVVNARHCEVSERFREHVASKLSKLAKHDARIMRVQVEVSNERNPRQAENAVRVELTAFTKGPVIRAEEAAVDKMGALDIALDKMAAQMRKAADRRRVHRGRHTPVSGAQAMAGAEAPVESTEEDAARVQMVAGLAVEGEGPLVVREKSHATAPMSLDQALYEMELVGHDFYLFVDKESSRPSVVYRRKGYDYGVIALDLVS